MFLGLIKVRVILFTHKSFRGTPQGIIELKCHIREVNASLSRFIISCQCVSMHLANTPFFYFQPNYQTGSFRFLCQTSKSNEEIRRLSSNLTPVDMIRCPQKVAAWRPIPNRAHFSRSSIGPQICPNPQISFGKSNIWDAVKAEFSVDAAT